MDRLLLTVDEAANRLSIGRSTLYEAVRMGAIRSVKIGAARRIPVSALAEFISRLEADASN